jgi:hypothetical protein
LREVAGWVEQYRRHWEDSFERLSDYLRDLQGTEKKEQGDDDGGDTDRSG